jgi:hypothetical protein
MDTQSGLRTSIRLFSSYSAAQLSEMLEVSSGIRPATASDGTIAYGTNARVPKEPWQPLDLSGMSTLFKLTSEWEQHQSVAILKPSEALEALLTKERWATRSYKSEEYPAMSKAVIDALIHECEFAPDYVFSGIARNDPDMLTVSIDKKQGKLVGLHVDYWQGLPLAKRRFAQNRISINIGPSFRYILFVPVTLEDMAALLASERGMQVDLPALPSVFMREFADFPVARCRLPPGASYIIPTENMLHDGSAAGQSVANRQVVFRGNIRPQYTRLVG